VRGGGSGRRGGQPAAEGDESTTVMTTTPASCAAAAHPRSREARQGRDAACCVLLSRPKSNSKSLSKNL
jgi:hypothetical protein